MKDTSFDYSAEEASPKRNIPRVGRSFLRRGGMNEDALEKGVFSRDIEGLFTTLVKEAEIDNVRFRIPRFLVCHDETCILRFVEAWSLFSNIYYIRLIFLIPRWRVSGFIKELVFLSTFTRFHFRVVNPLLRKCEFELPFEAKRRKRFLLLPSSLSLFPSLPLFPTAWIPTGNELSSFPLSRTENRLPNPREAFHFAQRKNSTAAV